MCVFSGWSATQEENMCLACTGPELNAQHHKIKNKWMWSSLEEKRDKKISSYLTLELWIQKHVCSQSTYYFLKWETKTSLIQRQVIQRTKYLGQKHMKLPKLRHVITEEYSTVFPSNKTQKLPNKSKLQNRLALIRILKWSSEKYDSQRKTGYFRNKEA
jgi:hypothetical protein